MASRIQHPQYLLAASDVARLVGVTPEAVRKWVRLGRLRVAAQAESGIRLFSRADVQRLMQQRDEQKRARHLVEPVNPRRGRAAAGSR